jgi:hypothetical protein
MSAMIARTWRRGCGVRGLAAGRFAAVLAAGFPGLPPGGSGGAPGAGGGGGGAGFVKWPALWVWPSSVVMAPVFVLSVTRSGQSSGPGCVGFTCGL